MCVVTIMETEEQLNEQIEALRTKMIEIGEKLGFLHRDVMEISQELDRLLLRYYKMIQSGGTDHT